MPVQACDVFLLTFSMVNSNTYPIEKWQIANTWKLNEKFEEEISNYVILRLLRIARRLLTLCYHMKMIHEDEGHQKILHERKANIIIVYSDIIQKDPQNNENIVKVSVNSYWNILDCMWVTFKYLFLNSKRLQSCTLIPIPFFVRKYAVKLSGFCTKWNSAEWRRSTFWNHLHFPQQEWMKNLFLKMIFHQKRWIPCIEHNSDENYSWSEKNYSSPRKTKKSYKWFNSFKLFSCNWMQLARCVILIRAVKTTVFVYCHNYWLAFIILCFVI